MNQLIKEFGQNIAVTAQQRKTADLNELLKFVNFVSLQENGSNASNIFKKSKINDMSINALKKTELYNRTKANENHKLNIQK